MRAPAELREVAEAGAEVICGGLVHVYPGEDGPIAALRNVELVVRAGEMVAILGPSGSGKTTLLSLLSGLQQPTAGTILIAGQNIARFDERRLSRLRATELALLLQDPVQNLIPYATSLENLEFSQRGARRRRWPLRWTPSELVERFNLEQVARRPVHELSSGEQQRVALAAAISTSPRILLADEPTTQLDPRGRDDVIRAMRQAHELSGATIVVVTHDKTVADALPRTVTINHGVIGSEGRGGESFAVLGGDGSLQLPAQIAAAYKAGTLFRVVSSGSAVELRPEPAAGRGPAEESASGGDETPGGWTEGAA